jgi:hypothetical protein
MSENEPLDVLGFQKITCKNPQCQNLFKTVHFLEGWNKKTIINNGSVLIQNDEEPYYACSKCGSKNYVMFQGEKIIIEKIIRFELPSEHRVAVATGLKTAINVDGARNTVNRGMFFFVNE